QRWWLAIERIGAEQSQHARTTLEQPALYLHHPQRLLPRPQRREPQIPIEAWLIRCIDPRPLEWILRLVAEGIRDPARAISPSLKFDLVTGFGHHGEQAVGIRDTKWCEELRGPCEDRRCEGRKGDDRDVERRSQRSV